jgi:hypothetical protein
MQPHPSRNTSVRDPLSWATGYACLGMLLSFGGCMAGPVEAERVEPGETSSELGNGPGPGITPSGGEPTGAAGAPASALISPPTAGGPAVAPTTAPCATDADCRVERDNCSECACHVLAATQHLDACYGSKVTVCRHRGSMHPKSLRSGVRQHPLSTQLTGDVAARKLLDVQKHGAQQRGAKRPGNPERSTQDASELRAEAVLRRGYVRRNSRFLACKWRDRRDSAHVGRR